MPSSMPLSRMRSILGNCVYGQCYQIKHRTQKLKVNGIYCQSFSQMNFMYSEGLKLVGFNIEWKRSKQRRKDKTDPRIARRILGEKSYFRACLKLGLTVWFVLADEHKWKKDGSLLGSSFKGRMLVSKFSFSSAVLSGNAAQRGCSIILGPEVSWCWDKPNLHRWWINNLVINYRGLSVAYYCSIT